jgi:hypothetical protein
MQPLGIGLLICIIVIGLSSLYSFQYLNEYPSDSLIAKVFRNTSPPVHIPIPTAPPSPWGTIFPITLVGNFPPMRCNYSGHPICCSALETPPPSQKRHKQNHRSCVVEKEYFPSPYELRHLAEAERLAKIFDSAERTLKTIEFIESQEEIEHAKRWLRRVAVRQPGGEIEETNDDREYLSRFKVTRICNGGKQADHSFWWEYIEPLSVHARHPFSFTQCLHPYKSGSYLYPLSMVPNRTSLFSIDYLLLQSRKDHNGLVRKGVTQSESATPANVYFFDAGTSRFDSSLSWFICVYQQVECALASWFSTFPHHPVPFSSF